jgi:hypothetical protein
MSLVSHKDLKQGFGIKKNSKLIRVLNDNKIKYWLVDDRPVTTTTALDKALFGDSKEPIL